MNGTLSAIATFPLETHANSGETVPFSCHSGRNTIERQPEGGAVLFLVGGTIRLLAQQHCILLHDMPVCDLVDAAAVSEGKW